MRLIDADKIKPEDFYDRVNMEECMEVINEQPTAYSVEAVVRELEAERAIAFVTLANSGDEALDKAWEYVSTYLDKAIAIVRGGRNE